MSDNRVELDFWYGDKVEDVTEIDIIFYPNAGEYRGNMWKGNKIIGDFITKNSVALEKAFPQLKFDWD